MIRIVFFVAGAALIGFVIFKVVELVRGPKNKCSKCNGAGYWEGLRSKEKCDQCRGTGVYPPKR